MRTVTIAAILVFALFDASGCKKDGTEKRDQSGTGEAKDRGDPGGDMAGSSDVDSSKPIDWPAEKRTVVKDRADGIAFTVEIPAQRLAKQVKTGDATLPGYVTWESRGNPFDAPGFTVQPIIEGLYPSSVESLKGGLLMPGQQVTLAEALPDGGYLVVVEESSKQYLHVAMYRKAPSGKALRFTISERRSKGIPRFDAEKAWAISVAKSLTLP